MRHPDFAQMIADNFSKTRNIRKTAEEMDLDVALVRYWLKASGVDIRGQAAYHKGESSKDSIILGSTIAMYRLQKGLGHPSDLAEAAGMSTKKIAMVERGEKDVLFTELVRIAKALGTSVSQLTYQSN